MKYILSICFVSFLLSANAQSFIIKGTVSDATSNQPLSNVSVSVLGSSNGVNTDENGRYQLAVPNKPTQQLSVTSIGYKSLLRKIAAGKDQVINIKLSAEGKTMNEVSVLSAKKEKYKNKDNPAVELIRKVIQNKDHNRPESYDYIEYKQYEKLQFSIINLSPDISNKKLLHQYKFLFDNRDTTTLPGKSLLPVFLSEKLSRNYYRKSPEIHKTVVEGSKIQNIINFVDNEGINTYLNRMYAQVDIYSNNIFLMTNQFLSPIADAAPTFYKFFITDTLVVNNTKLVGLSFTPRNGNDMLFEGEIYVTLDGNYAVEKARLSINKNINLNWVRGMKVDLSYESSADGRYHLSRSYMAADFGITKKGLGGIFGERTLTFKNYVFNKTEPENVYTGPEIEMPAVAQQHDPQFWAASRGKDTLTRAEAHTYKNIDSLQKMPAYRRTMDVIDLLTVGFKTFDKFEVGPINTFASFNAVEGFRTRLGGRTTTGFSTRYYFESYGAYGFRDKQFKYLFAGSYAFNNKSIYTFPQHYLRASVQREIKIPGAEVAFSQQDNLFLSFKRGEDNKYLYNNYYKLDYVSEFENHFSYNLQFKNWRQEPAGSLYFVNQVNGLPNYLSSVTTTELAVGFRYAPHERLIQGKLYRIPIPSKYPVISLDYKQGVKGLFNGEYNYQNLHLRVDKRFYLSQLGYTDVSFEGAYLFGQVPFPLLTIHRANQTFAYEPDSYNLMNFLEFVSDHYAGLNVEHCFNGFFFNKIPLVKKLKWREYITFKTLYGGVRDENNPDIHPNLLQYPVNAQHIPETYTLGKTPYTEGSVGIGNIFKVLRLDLVERFNYLDHPNATHFGVRTSALFDF
ncbi:DUF5686 and carboxypeptidase-like regulatory domain-containing protein [Mucilaginibacter paludis]|uniref:Carboxypeptidase-like regulatory domain-containing protein n=1 Tax=Mucilaginibacter paludis DSM 18603 TaxID=714943 RepID=H1Y5J2_9SPHI|nr:DUF5686 and carboxypeptidase-like regulatory domain-containing protein [Mucilaginibacter paludis]EHQ29344.1 hypothetical protein Mucpa_5269 [Mucilaginibacter paludis DSM 18603]